MSISVTQVVFGDDNSGGYPGNLGTTVALTITPATGDTILIFAVCDGGASNFAPTSVSDSVVGAYTSVTAAAPSNNNNWMGTWYKKGVTNATRTITATFSGSTGYKCICAVAISDNPAGAALDASAALKDTSAPGTTANAVTGNAVTTTSAVALLVSLCYQDEAQAGVPSAGTGFTSGGTGWAMALGLGDFARVESQRYTSAGAKTPTFTATNGTANHVVMSAAFDELVTAIPSNALFFGNNC
jgi:hypothetical protein